MERLRRELIQKMPNWGDPSPGDGTKSGQIQLSHNILQHCQATYKAMKAYLEKSDVVKSMPPRRPVDPTNCEPVFIQEWTFDSLISHSPNFKSIRRVSALSDAAIISRELKAFESEGVPLIIEDWHKHTRWPKEEFTLEWFKSNCSPNIPVRNVIDGSDKVMSISDLIDKCRSAPCAESEAGQERLYGKDVECPDRWRDLLDQIGLPSHILPGNSTDLLSNQPVKVRVKTLMCYLGAGGTFTPCHKDSCASSGQNLMCYTESGGSAFWFMTATSDIFLATQYFHSIKQELDHERHLIAIDKLAEAPFPIYIAEQKLGDLVLVPSRSCHQVINKGGITIKTSWSRMTLDGLIAANYHELPVYQRVCRGEIYRVKFTVYNTIKTLVESLNAGGREQIKRRANSRLVGPGTRQRKMKILRGLLSPYVDILDDERPPPGFTDLRYICDSPKPSPCNIDNPQEFEEDRIICDFCGADIFQSFFECSDCIVENGTAESGGGCVICPRCYVDGRTCRCGNMVAMQCRQFQILEDIRTAAVEVLGKQCKSRNDPDTSAKNKFNGLGIFAAACFKYQSSLSDVNSTIGISRDTQNHDGMYCSGCRRTCSFQHLFAKYETHAVDVLLGSQDQQSCHKRVHGRDRKGYGEHDIIAFAESVKAGTRPNLQFQRFHNVAYFATCLPASQIVRPGYYDEVWDTTERPHQLTFHANQTIIRKRRKPTLQHVSTSLTTWHPEAMSPLSPLSALDVLSSDEQVLAHASANTQTKRRKRFVIDCIEVPLRRALAKERNVEGGCSLPSERHGLEIKAELVEDTMQEQTGSNAKCVDRCDHDQIPRESTRLRDTNDDQVACTSEGRKNASKQSLQKGNAKKRKIATKSDAGKSDRRKVNSTQITRQKKGVKKKMSSNIRAGDGVDKPTPVNQPQRQMPVLARGSIEHPLSGDDSDTVVARTPQLHESIGQPRALQNTLSEHSLIPIHRELSFDSGMEVSPVGRAAESAKRPLDRQSATNTGDDWTPAPKRRRLARNPQQEINTYNDSTLDVRQNSEPDCGASQLANILSSALTANDSISGSVNPAGWRSRDIGEGSRRSVVHDHERPKQADPQQASLSVDETGWLKREINRLTNRVAVLETALEKRLEETPAVNFIVPSSPPQQLYCLPIPFGQIEGIFPSLVENRLLKSVFREIGRRFPAPSAVITHRASNRVFGHQYSQYHQYPQFSQYPQYPAGPSKYPQINRIYGQSNKQPPISPRLWRNRGEQRPPGGNLNREKHQDNSLRSQGTVGVRGEQRLPGGNLNREKQQDNSHRSHGTVGVPEASDSRRFNRWSSPVVGPSNTNRYPRRTVGEREKFSQRWSRAPLPSPSRHGEQGASDGDGKRCDNDNQHAQEQDVTGWSLSHGWDSRPISNDAANENQHAQKQAATGRGLSHGWGSAPMSNDAANNENQYAQEQITTGWGSPPICDDATTNENQRAQEQVATGWDSSSRNVAATNENRRAQEQVGTGERLSHGWDSPSSNDAATNEKQRAQEQVGMGERLSHGWDSPMGNTNEEQERQWEDNYVQDDDGVGTKVAPGGEGSHKSWTKDADSGKAAAVLDAPWMNNPWNS